MPLFTHRQLLENRQALRETAWSFGAPDKTFTAKDGPRNLELAVLLDERGGPASLRLNNDEHGTDGWLSWPHGWKSVEPVELKSAFRKNQFRLYAWDRETPELLRRLISEPFVFVVSERATDDAPERISEVYYVPTDSELHDELRVRLFWIQYEPEKKRHGKQVTYNRVVKDLAAIRLL